MQLLLKRKRKGVRKIQRLEYDSSEARLMEIRFGKAFVEWVNRNLYDIILFQTMIVSIDEVRFTIIEVGNKYFEVGKKYPFNRRFANIFNGSVEIVGQYYDEGWIYQIEWKDVKYWVRQVELLRLLTEDILIDSVVLPDPFVVTIEKGSEEEFVLMKGDFSI